MDVSSLSTEVLGERAAVCDTHGAYTSSGNALTVFNRRREYWTGCPQCAQIKRERQAEERRASDERERQARIEDRMRRAGIPKRFRTRTLDNFEATTPKQQRALRVAREFVADFARHHDEGSTLVFAGNVGTGKGHLALGIAQALIAAGHTAFYATAREIIMRMRASWSDKSAPSEAEVLDMLTSVSLLIVDEVGVTFGSDAERDQLFAVIDGRYRECLPTIYTTNLERDELPVALGERSFDRLRENGRWVAFDWESYRGRK